jgi:hypothetical protein
MGPAVVVGGVVALSLLAVGLTMRRTAPGSRSQTPPFRQALPWVLGGVLVVGTILVVMPGVPAVVTVGLVAYTGVAVTSMWRLAALDRSSRWMTPARRRTRFGIAAVALTWLGIVLGLLLRIADLLAAAPYGP